MERLSAKSPPEMERFLANHNRLIAAAAAATCGILSAKCRLGVCFGQINALLGGCFGQIHVVWGCVLGKSMLFGGVFRANRCFGDVLGANWYT